MSDNLLEIKDLSVVFDTERGKLAAVDAVSFAIEPGETLGLVGESGCGKSVTALAILRLLSPPGRIAGGEIRFEGKDLLSLRERDMRSIRGNRISMIFQEPMTSLNPVFTAGEQVAEAIRLHQKLPRRAAWAEAVRMLDLVAISDPARRAREYPHQLSGGMRQRVMIAMALSCRPSLLIADEPTTALDVTIQAQILELLARLKEEMGLSILLITHDLGIVAEACQRVVVMYLGRIVEEARVEDLFAHPSHPYTGGLLQSLPNPHRVLGGTRQRLHPIPGMVPDLEHLPSGCRFRTRCPHVMDICQGDVPLYLVGERHTSRCLLHDPDVAAGKRGVRVEAQALGSLTMAAGGHS